jgi:hypothetical protein
MQKQAIAVNEILNINKNKSSIPICRSSLEGLCIVLKSKIVEMYLLNFEELRLLA